MNAVHFWLTVNSLFIGVAFFTLFLLVRQVGILMGHLGPVGARQTRQGPRVGENVAAHIARHIGLTFEQPTLLIFGSQSCAVCELVSAAAETLCRHWRSDARFVLVYDEPDAAAPRLEDRLRFGVRRLTGDGLRQALDIKLLPFALMVDEEGLVVARGLVNDISHLESLLETYSQRPPALRRAK